MAGKRGRECEWPTAAPVVVAEKSSGGQRTPSPTNKTHNMPGRELFVAGF